MLIVTHLKHETYSHLPGVKTAVCICCLTVFMINNKIDDQGLQYFNGSTVAIQLTCISPKTICTTITSLHMPINIITSDNSLLRPVYFLKCAYIPTYMMCPATILGSTRI